MLQNNKIIKLFFDWNDIDECENKDYFYENQSLQETKKLMMKYQAKFVTQYLKMPPQQKLKFQIYSKIKSLMKILSFVFYDGLGLQTLFTLMGTYNKISYLGLGANHLNQLTPLINKIGKKVLSAEELHEYRKKEQERDAIVQRNLKNKGKNQEEVPYLDVVKDVGQDKFAYFYNEQLQQLNLIQNDYSEQDKDVLELFLTYAFDGFTLSLSANNFEKKTIERFKKKFGQKILFY